MELDLVVEDDQGRRTVMPLQLGEATVGRDASNTVRLDERNVSRHHLRMFSNNDGIVVEDLDSYNGVWVNGNRLEGRHCVTQGDLIRVGDFQLELRGDALRVPEDTVTAGQVLEPTQPDFRFDEDLEADTVTDAPVAQTPPPMKPPKAVPQDEEPTSIIRMSDDPSGEQQTPAAALAVSDQPRLICVSTHLAGTEFPISKTESIIGRTPDNDIVIQHRSVSRHHAAIRITDGRVNLVDMKSANGILVNGESYAHTELKQGDLIELGHVRLRYLPPGAKYNFSAEELSKMRNPSARPTLRQTVGRALTEGGFDAWRQVVRHNVFLTTVVVVLVLLIGGMGFWVNKQPPLALFSPGQAEEVIIDAENVPAMVAKGREHLKRQKWQDAQRLAQTALEVDPKHKGAQRLLERSEREGKAQGRAEAALKAVGAEDWPAAWEHVSAVPKESAFYDPDLVAQIRNAYGAQLVREIQEAAAQNDRSRFDAALSQLRDVDSAHPEIPQLAALGSAIVNKTTAPVAKTSSRPKPARKAPPPRKRAPPPTVSARDRAMELYMKGTAALRQGSSAEAIEQFSACIKVDRNYAKCYRAMGIAYAKAGNGERAARFYELYLKYAPNAPDAAQVKKYLSDFRQ